MKKSQQSKGNEEALFEYNTISPKQVKYPHREQKEYLRGEQQDLYLYQEQDEDLSQGQKQRLRQRCADLEQVWTRLREKLHTLQMSSVIETKPDEKFRLQQQILETKHEMDLFEQQIEDIEKRLSPYRNKGKDSIDLEFVQLILKAMISTFGETQREHLIDILATLLKIDKQSIETLYVMKGSIQVVLQLPTNAANELISLFEQKSDKLKSFIDQFSVQDIRLITSPQDLHEFTIIKQKESSFLKKILRLLSQSKVLAFDLRSNALTISREDAWQEDFELNERSQPKRYIKNKFEDCEDVIMDCATGLMWQKSGSAKPLDYKAVQIYIEILNRKQFRGYNDWRLPTIPELVSLVERHRQTNSQFVNLMFDPVQTVCWSSDKESSQTAWRVDFHVGLVHWSLLKEYHYVRAVRSLRWNELKKNTN